MSWAGCPTLGPWSQGPPRPLSSPWPRGSGWVLGLPHGGPSAGTGGRACLLVGCSVAVPGVARLGEAAVVCAVARAVDCVAVLKEGPVGRVVAQVTGGPVAVDL